MGAAEHPNHGCCLILQRDEINLFTTNTYKMDDHVHKENDKIKRKETRGGLLELLHSKQLTLPELRRDPEHEKASIRQYKHVYRGLYCTTTLTC